MYDEDRFHPTDENDIDNNSGIEQYDRGLCTILEQIVTAKGTIVTKKKKVFTTAGVGTKIRNAASGMFYPHKVGSRGEDNYFKVVCTSNKINSQNGSKTLFYNGPNEYMTHMNCSLDPAIIDKWEEKQLQLRRMPQYKI